MFPDQKLKIAYPFKEAADWNKISLLFFLIFFRVHRKSQIVTEPLKQEPSWSLQLKTHLELEVLDSAAVVTLQSKVQTRMEVQELE